MPPPNPPIEPASSAKPALTAAAVGAIAARLEKVEVVKYSPTDSGTNNQHPEVWHLRDPQTGKEYYAKKADPEQVAMTLKADRLNLPEDSVLKIAKVLTANPADIPIALKSQISPQIAQNGFLIVEAVPHGDGLGALGLGDASPEWKSKPITAAEYDRLLHDVRQMNEAGVLHHDLLSNTEVVRGKDGKLKVYVYDFEPHVFNPMYPGKLEDHAHVIGAGHDMIDEGNLLSDAKRVLSKHDPDVAGHSNAQASSSTLKEQRDHDQQRSAASQTRDPSLASDNKLPSHATPSNPVAKADSTALSPEQKTYLDKMSKMDAETRRVFFNTMDKSAFGRALELPKLWEQHGNQDISAVDPDRHNGKATLQQTGVNPAQQQQAKAESPTPAGNEGARTIEQVVAAKQAVQPAFDIPTQEEHFRPAVNFEHATGLQGISRTYVIPDLNTVTPLGVSFTSNDPVERAIQLERALDRHAGNLGINIEGVKTSEEFFRDVLKIAPPPAASPDQLAEYNKQLGTIVDHVVAANPELKDIKYDKTSAFHKGALLLGVTSGINPSDIQYYIDSEKIARELHGNTPLHEVTDDPRVRPAEAKHQEVQEKAGRWLGWAPSPNTLDHIDRQLNERSVSSEHLPQRPAPDFHPGNAHERTGGMSPAGRTSPPRVVVPSPIGIELPDRNATLLAQRTRANGQSNPSVKAPSAAPLPAIDLSSTTITISPAAVISIVDTAPKPAPEFKPVVTDTTALPQQASGKTPVLAAKSTLTPAINLGNGGVMVAAASQEIAEGLRTNDPVKVTLGGLQATAGTASVIASTSDTAGKLGVAVTAVSGSYNTGKAGYDAFNKARENGKDKIDSSLDATSAGLIETSATLLNVAAGLGTLGLTGTAPGTALKGTINAFKEGDGLLDTGSRLLNAGKDTLNATLPAQGAKGFATLADPAVRQTGIDLLTTQGNIATATDIAGHFSSPLAIKATTVASNGTNPPKMNGGAYPNLNALKSRLGFDDKDMTDGKVLDQLSNILDFKKKGNDSTQPNLWNRYAPEILGGMKRETVLNEESQRLITNAAVDELKAYRANLDTFKSAPTEQKVNDLSHEARQKLDSQLAAALPALSPNIGRGADIRTVAAPATRVEGGAAQIIR